MIMSLESIASDWLRNGSPESQRDHGKSFREPWMRCPKGEAHKHQSIVFHLLQLLQWVCFKYESRLKQNFDY